MISKIKEKNQTNKRTISQAQGLLKEFGKGVALLTRDALLSKDFV